MKSVRYGECLAPKKFQHLSLRVPWDSPGYTATHFVEFDNTNMYETDRKWIKDHSTGHFSAPLYQEYNGECWCIIYFDNEVDALMTYLRFA